LLTSRSAPDRHYVGSTIDLKRRLAEHNAGESIHTRKYLPWSLEAYMAFSDPLKADRFEAYLKSGSGRSFAKRHF
jgi:predicted GIY-YIG superfamily endonuclease